ncbi:pyridoxamine 5'-phosphate oxidase family protein [Streptomyces sp. NBC_00454]|uniref:pyridoxamine 5'-phosphate oxidase family protein n=1 Tax=Streptomyces sp. NBC_00454 TaxID=2975747 RepID=UPI0030E4948F
MTSRYAQIAFTDTVRRHQSAHGSARGYDRMAAAGPCVADRLGPDEAQFIAERDSVYLASVSETGWPYIQHRGGPRGFLRVLGPDTVAFADYRGNKQYITTGNLDHNDRIALFLMDYQNRARLKLFGRARAVPAGADPELLAAVRDEEYPGEVERIVVISVEAFDWNCSQHLVPRFDRETVRAAMADLVRENAELKAELARRPR